MLNCSILATTLQDCLYELNVLIPELKADLQNPSFWMTMIAGTGYVHNTFYIKGILGWLFWPFILQPIQGVAALLLCLFVPFGGWPHVILYCSIQMAVNIWIEVMRHRLYKAEKARKAEEKAALARGEL